MAHSWGLIGGDTPRVVLSGDGIGRPRAESLDMIRTYILNFLLQVQINIRPVGRCILTSQICPQEITGAMQIAS